MIQKRLWIKKSFGEKSWWFFNIQNWEKAQDQIYPGVVATATWLTKLC